MRLCYVLLSPTFGMHQYTADIANRMALAGHEVHLVTTTRYPRDRYLPVISVHTPVHTRNSGFSLDALRPVGFRALRLALTELDPDLVHFTGPHLWNVAFLRFLRRRHIPTVHTLHDLDPHSGAAYGRLLWGWNRLVIGAAGRILVHGELYRQQLLDRGVPAERIICTPLLHLFVGAQWAARGDELAAAPCYEPWALFFGRLERYKGLPDLLAAYAALPPDAGAAPRLVVAGPGPLEENWAADLPPGVELRNRLITDEEAIDLFRRCGLVVLPYRDASQSALVAAAYFFRKPVIVTRTGALPEYVQEGRTGWIVPPGDHTALTRAIAAALADRARLAAFGAAGRAWYDGKRLAEGQALRCLYEQLAQPGQDAESSRGHC